MTPREPRTQRGVWQGPRLNISEKPRARYSRFGCATPFLVRRNNLRAARIGEAGVRWAEVNRLLTMFLHAGRRKQLLRSILLEISDGTVSSVHAPPSGPGRRREHPPHRAGRAA